MRWVVSMPPGAGSERSIRTMSGDVSSARSTALAGIVGLADDLEVGLAAEDVGDAHPEQGVVVDDEDPRPFSEVPAIRTPAPSFGPAVIVTAHVLSSAPVAPSWGSRAGRRCRRPVAIECPGERRSARLARA